VAIAGAVVLHSLDRPWVKRRLQGLARSSAGIDVDYRAARVDLFSGAAIDGLVVQSPAEVRAFAPDLVRADRVEARWSLWSLLLGHGPAVERLAVSNVTLCVVVDEHGRTSFDALASAPSSPTPAVPLSRLASNFLGSAPPIGRLDVDRVTLTLVQTDHGEISDRSELRGVALALAARSAEPAARGWRVEAGLGSPKAPLDLELSRAGEVGSAGTARAKLWLTVDATSAALTAILDVRMTEQTFAARIAADHWLHAEAKLRFDPTAGRTELTLDHTEAGDGAVTAEASMDLLDVGSPIVHHARGDIDIARLLSWLPPGLVPVTAERARVHVRADSLVTGPTVKMSDGGAVDVDAEISNVAVTTAFAAVHVGGGELSLHAQAMGSGAILGRGSVKLAAVRLASGDERVAADDLALDFEGQQGSDAAIAGRVGVRFARVEQAGASSVVAQAGHVEVRVDGLHPDTDEPLRTRGDLAVSAEVGSLDVTMQARARAIADGLTLHAHTALEGHAPYAVELAVTATRLRAMAHDGKVVADAPARIEGHATDVRPDVDRPAASRGILHATVDLGATEASLDVTKEADAADFAFRATAHDLKAVRPFLPEALTKRAPWDRMAVAVGTSGHVERLGGDPSMRQTTEVHVENPAFDDVAARSVVLILKSEGTTTRHHADVELRALGLAFAGGASSDDHATLSATLDRDRPSLQFELATEGRATTKLTGDISFDPRRRALVYALEGRFAELALLGPFAAQVRGLDAFDLSHLEVGLSARGALLGVVAGLSRDGAIQLERQPASTAAVEGTTELRVAHFRWSKGDTAIVTPSATWHGDMRTTGGRRTLDSRLEVGTLHLDLGSRDVDLNGIDDQASVAVIGNLVDPEIELTQRLGVQAVEQTVLPEYPMGDLAVALSAERGPEGVVHISDMKVTNGLGGTALALTGNLDLGEGRRTLSVTTSLTQDLARLSTIPARFRGRGKVSVDANVTSPDLARYGIRASVKGENVSVTLARAGVDVQGANGDVPITVTLAVGPKGVALERSEKGSPYSMLRFADQHPLLTRSGFLSITRLKTPFASIAPLVGNLEVEQNVISLRQFEMGVRGGNITGQCGLVWEGGQSTLELHVRASGVQSSHGEPFDGNIAVAISAADRTIDGRAEVLRIGPRHLLDLLDLEDPLHVDPAINRIRGALVFGYPDSLRLVFDHGFASAHLELGGLARLISIGELRGIPMGPIVDRMLAPLFDAPDTKETP
jgi:translocation and assembly module TamB